jgi:hypothetical protein
MEADIEFAIVIMALTIVPVFIVLGFSVIVSRLDLFKLTPRSPSCSAPIHATQSLLQGTCIRRFYASDHIVLSALATSEKSIAQTAMSGGGS